MALTEKEFLTALARKLGRAPLDAPPSRPGHGRLKPPPPANAMAQEAMSEWFVREIAKLTGTTALTGTFAEAGAAVAAYAVEHLTAGGVVILWNDPVSLCAKDPLEAAGFQVIVGKAERAAYASAEAGVTSAVYAVAETGSIALEAAPQQARLTSLVPPVHIAIVPTSRLMATVGDYFRTLANREQMPASLNLITGPSRTADIELELSIGVHGPGKLHVVLVNG